LATPIRPHDRESDDAAMDAVDHKLTTLALVHNVNLEGPNAGWDLAIALAQAHVPGLRFAEARGGVRRKATWLAGLGELLRREVDDIREQRHCRQGKAIADLRADKSKRWSKIPPLTLAARYGEASRRYRCASQRDRMVLGLMANAFAKSD